MSDIINPVERTNNGYFQNRIRIYVQQYHPDLLVDIEAFEEMLISLVASTIDNVLMLDKEGFQSTEAIERSLIKTLEDIYSPYGFLRDFIIENEDTILQLTGSTDLTDENTLLRILPLVSKEIEIIEFSASLVDVANAKARLLRTISITLLQRN